MLLNQTVVLRLPARRLVMAFTVTLTAIFLLHKPDYLLFSIFFWFGLITLPLSVHIDAGKRSNRLLVPTLALGATSLAVPTTIGVYMLLLLAVGCITERYLGRLNWAGMVHALLLSPMFTYLSTLVSFPIRLQLSAWSGSLMQLAGLEVSIQGNLVTWQQHEFLVDQACSGLHMLGYGLLFGTIMLNQLTRYKPPALAPTLLLYVLLAGLIVGSNVCRIILLIVLKAQPGHWLHEGIGLLCFAVYVLLPFFLVVRRMLSHKPEVPTGKMPLSDKAQGFITPSVLLLLLFGLVCWRNVHRSEPQATTTVLAGISGYTLAATKKGIPRYDKAGALLYVKPPVSPYHADHNPMVCWQGSGYIFERVYKKAVKGVKVNVAVLTKGDDKLYTAWWFDDGQQKTGSQFGWRWQAIQSGTNFALINLTCPSEKLLIQEATNLVR